MKKLIMFFGILALLYSCKEQVAEENVSEVFIISADPFGGTMPDKQYATTDAAPSVISLRYWKISNPGIRWTATFDTNGIDMNTYRLAYSTDGGYFTGSGLVNQMKIAQWEGQTFDYWMPINRCVSQTISRYDTLTVVNPDGSSYLVIGWHTYPNPAYDPNCHADYIYRKEVFESKLREWFLIEERMWFPIIPGTPDYKWQLVYNYRQPGEYFVDITPVPNKWNGQKWMVTDEDHYAKFAYWGAVMAYKPYWLGTAQISIQ